MAKSFHQYSPRAQAIVCALLSVGVMGAAWTVLIEPERAEVKSRRERLAVVTAEVAKATLVAQRLPAVQKEVASLEAALLQTTAVLSDEKDGEVVLRGLHGLASQSNLSISSFTPKPIAEREQYTEWPIEVGLEGGYHDLARFFDRVASDPRLISVSNLQFKINTVPARRALVHATWMATTFVFTPTVPGGKP
ncbi:MAG: type 4a pilus biogenesis protein PilO [Vicinamibacterales bacterium]